ncbi:PREDICTED: uncharacterized protein LOC109329322 [Lupinus angustifolius]|uniref:uncharacterized protein LOC109329322 n=1 Tax=Lupinus angustifolius TaxID=3871 RepID=UPI00092EB641|nr:PREDICTED: uncharacterized protein LOC109329322 [Lupinus angustifolius]
MPLARPNNIDQYDGTLDPKDHLDTFEVTMLFHGASNPIMCWAYPLTLRCVDLQWFMRLIPNSIDQWSTLADKFNVQFTTSKELPRSSYTLSSIRQGLHETIYAYLNIFNVEAMKMCTLSPDVAVHLLVTGLQDALFTQELVKYSDVTMENLRSKALQFINLEETHHIQSPTQHHEYRPSQEDKRSKFHDPPISDPPKFPRKSKYAVYTPLNAR